MSDISDILGDTLLRFNGGKIVLLSGLLWTVEQSGAGGQAAAAPVLATAHTTIKHCPPRRAWPGEQRQRHSVTVWIHSVRVLTHFTVS